MSSKSYSSAADNRTQFASGSGLQVAPQGAVNATGAGSVNAAAGAAVNQTIHTTNEGYVAEDVAQLLGMIEEDRANERTVFASLGQSMTAGILAQSTETASILADTKTPDSSTLKQLMPLLVLLALALLVFAKR